ncbi:MAG TPA: cell envelope integrity protein TolA [Gallionellaceae bacterium]
MSTLAYQEPYRFSAGLMTLVIHALFFALLYLGVNWQVQQPQGMEVEIWSELPETSIPPAAPPSVMPPPAPEHAKPKAAEQSAPPAKADIELKDKKKKTEVEKAAKPEAKKKPTRAEQKRMQEDILAMDQQAEAVTTQELTANQAKAAQAAKANAAITSEVEKYRALISSKIRSKIVMPPDVPDNALAIFDITLLVDGSVLDKKLIKSSGNAQYDDEVERAILKAQPLPLPKSDAARERFINPNHLKFKFSPQDGE